MTGDQEATAQYPFDPELAAALPQVPHFNLGDIEESRRLDQEFCALAPEADSTGVEIREWNIPVSGDEMLVRVYRPLSDVALPAIYDLHAGGFCVGSIESNHSRNIELARQVHAVVISANYRLAPEHPFPTPLEDCYAGAVWIVDHAAELGVDPERIAAHGHSAGASLAAAVCLLARDRGTPRFTFQYLGYPALDDRLQTPSMVRFIDTPMWDRPNAELSWAHYLGDAAGTHDVSIYAAPGRAEDLSGLPPACVTAMQFDPLRDEDVDYARRLLAADVPTELHVYPGTFHGSGAIPSAWISGREADEEVAVLRRALHH
jgi:acetyl esterase